MVEFHDGMYVNRIRLIRIPYTYYDDLNKNHHLLIDIINDEHEVILPEYD